MGIANLPATFLCGSTYRSKLGFTNPNHCFMQPSISLPRSDTSLRTANRLGQWLEMLKRKISILRRDKQVSESASQKIWKGIGVNCADQDKAGWIALPSCPVVPRLLGRTMQKYPPESKHGENKLKSFAFLSRVLQKSRWEFQPSCCNGN